MPGVLILEAMAQVAGLILLSVPEHQGKLAYIGSVKNAKFRKPVVPGDTLITEAILGRVRGTMGEVRMTATVEGEVVARCEMMFALMTPASPKPVDRLKGE